MVLYRFKLRQTVRCITLLLIMFAASGLHAQDATIDVPFLTVRDFDGSRGASAAFGDSRSSLRAGLCAVEEEEPSVLTDIVQSGPTFLREQLLSVEEVKLQSPDGLITARSSETQHGLALFVHGYFTDFDKGCRRAALLQRNAVLEERMVWFTWPSDGDIANYVQDETDLYWSVPDIADAILAVNAQSRDAGGADIIGHSLGGRGVALALAEVAVRAPETQLGDVVLLAPDMDFEIFARLLPRIRPIAKRITLYMSSADRPLDLSEELHGYPRLGQAGNNVTILDGVEVIDVSRLPTESASGHLYHIHNSVVGQDLDRLLNSDLPASQRPQLEAMGPNMWALLPN